MIFLCALLLSSFPLVTSLDLLNWTLITNNMVPEFTKDNNYTNYWMPNVGYNSRTGQFVMAYWSSKEER